MKDFTVKYGLKNFFKCLKYIFVPLGLLCLGAILGLSIAIPLCEQSLSNLFEELVNSAQNATIDTKALRSEFLSVVGELDWGAPKSALESLTDKAWLTTALARCMTALTGLDYSQNGVVSSGVEDAADDVFWGILIFFLFISLAFIGGYILARYLIRKELASRSVWKFFIVYLIHGLATLGMTVLGVWLVSVWQPSVFIFPIVFFLFMSVLSMFEAYIVHGWHHVPMKKIVTTKNVGTKLLSDLIIFLIWVASVAIITAIFNKFAGIVVGILIFEIASIVINLNAEAYVKSAVEKTL